jgi:DNA repair protein RecO (recombination protein O)
MQAFRIEGIILQAIPFQDFDQILTVFTPEEGIIKMFVKRAFSSKNGKGTLTAPLSHAEFVCTAGKSDLYSCREISMYNQHLKLRESISTLEAATDFLQALLKSQLPQKPVPDLFKLLNIYLEKIPVCVDPYALAVSFRLKILRFEGLLGLGPICTQCEAPLDHNFAADGESFCQKHAPPYALEFTQTEAELIEVLAFSKNFSQLCPIKIDPEFFHKIKLLFHDLVA